MKSVKPIEVIEIKQDTKPEIESISLQMNTAADTNSNKPPMFTLGNNLSSKQRETVMKMLSEEEELFSRGD